MKNPPVFNQSFLAGMRAGLPVVFGFIPTAIAYAVMARNAGLDTAQVCLMSIFVFAGASQMMVSGMIAQGAGLFTMILATFLLNFRHVIMSVCVFRRLKGGSLLARLLAGFGITDESFAIFTTIREEQCSFGYFFGLLISTYAAWVGGSLIGALASDLLPPLLSAGLGIALYAMFLALLLPSVRGNAGLGALVLLTAVCNTLLNQVMASSHALIVSTVLCAAIGVFFVDLKEEESHG